MTIANRVERMRAALGARGWGRWPLMCKDRNAAAGRPPKFVNADKRVTVICNPRTGTGSLIKLVKRRDRWLRESDYRDFPVAMCRMIMVRHPVDRLVSVFFDACVDVGAEFVTGNRRRRRFGDLDPLSRRFDVFLDDVTEALAVPERCGDLRLLPQSEVMMRGGGTYDLIGRLETFDSDIRRLERAAEIRLLPDDPWDCVHINQSGARAARLNITQRQRERIRALYAVDFARLGYREACGAVSSGVRSGQLAA